LLIDLEPDRGLVLQPVDADRVRQIGIAAIDEGDVDVRITKDQAVEQREGERIRHDERHVGVGARAVQIGDQRG
jgi:hypothetical protein